MKKIYFGILVVLTISLYTTRIFAQDHNDDLSYRKWRIALFPPISTNGTQAINYSAKYSINIIAGYNGALDGYEVAALFNYNKYYSSGFQIAGLANLTSGDMEGFNIAGGINYSKSDMAGIQLSGIANISEDRLEGLQFSGGINYSEQGSSGFQVAGLGNLSKSNIEGLQGSGFFNITNGDLSGLQAASVFNFARDNVEGLQAAGVFNFAGDDISGLQLAGFGNIAMEDIEGLLLSGFLNLSKGDASGLIASGGLNVSRNIEGLSAAGIGNIAQSMEGLQVGGFNFSEKSIGLQIGLVNIAKEFDGASIGLISLYGNGRKNFDIRYSDAGFTDLALTTGTHRVYNSFLFGYNTVLDRNVYRVGMAVGLEKNVQDSFENVESTTLFVNQEFSIVHLFEEEWSKQKNRIYTYKYMLGNRFGNGFSIYGGPNLNMQVTRTNNTNDYTWYSLWSPSRKGNQYRFWVGFTVGMRLFHQKNLPLISDEFDNDWGWEKEW